MGRKYAVLSTRTSVASIVEANLSRTLESLEVGLPRTYDESRYFVDPKPTSVYKLHPLERNLSRSRTPLH